MSFIRDEELIAEYRKLETTDIQKTKLFKHMLERDREKQSSWDKTIKKYVRWRILKMSGGFDIYSADDLYQRCLCCFYKAMSEKYDLQRTDTKFSTYMYAALEKTVNRVIVELRKKKRTIELEFIVNGEIVKRRISPNSFTDSLQKPINLHEKSLTLDEIIPEPNDDISEQEALIAEAAMEKCKKLLTPIQFEILINSDVRGLSSGKQLAEKYNKSEPTISAIKKRKINKALKRVRRELVEEFQLSPSMA